MFTYMHYLNLAHSEETQYPNSFELGHVRGPARHTLPSEMLAEFEEIRQTRRRFALCAAQVAAAAKVSLEFHLILFVINRHLA